MENTETIAEGLPKGYGVEKESKEFEKLIMENSTLKESLIFYQKELKNLRKELQRTNTPPLVISEIVKLTNDNKAIIKLPTQNTFLVEISQDINFESLEIGDLVTNDQKSLMILEKLDLSKNFEIENFVIMNKNKNLTWKDIGGLEKEIEKVREVLELPLKDPKKFKKMGVEPPKGILLHGPPGTGKTLIAKALANETNSTFIELVGGELVQKFIGEGAKLVKDLFKMARERAPAIIFIDEIDAIASSRVEVGTSGEREVQRTFMQLLGEIDGFKPLDNIKIIGATNRPEILDEAIIRPGRLERHISIEVPNEKGRINILKLHTKKMLIGKDVNFNELSNLTKGFSGAKLKALTTEAGYLAIKEKKEKISQKNFLVALDEIKENDKKINKDEDSIDVKTLKSFY